MYEVSTLMEVFSNPISWNAVLGSIGLSSALYRPLRRTFSRSIVPLVRYPRRLLYTRPGRLLRDAVGIGKVVALGLTGMYIFSPETLQVVPDRVLNGLWWYGLSSAFFTMTGASLGIFSQAARAAMWGGIGLMLVGGQSQFFTEMLQKTPSSLEKIQYNASPLLKEFGNADLVFTNFDKSIDIDIPQLPLEVSKEKILELFSHFPETIFDRFSPVTVSMFDERQYFDQRQYKIKPLKFNPFIKQEKDITLRTVEKFLGQL